MKATDHRMIAVLSKTLGRDSDVRLAYLHGSHARGYSDAESDVDIAVLADPSLSKDQRYDLRIKLMGAVAECPDMPSKKIDLVILQDVPVLLQFNIIRNRIVLFERDRNERISYELRVEQAYDDEQYYLERESQVIMQRIFSRSTS